MRLRLEDDWTESLLFTINGLVGAEDSWALGKTLGASSTGNHDNDTDGMFAARFDRSGLHMVQHALSICRLAQRVERRPAASATR